MSCSCCQPATLPQPNDPPSDAAMQIDMGSQNASQVNDVVSTVRGNPGAVGASNLDITVEDGCDKDGAPPDTSCQDVRCGSVSANTKIEEAQNDNNHPLPSIQCPANACHDNDSSRSSKQKTGPGSCCEDQPSETFCNTDVSTPSDSAEGDSEEGLVIEASEGKNNTYLRAHLPRPCSSTLPSSNFAPTESRAPECCSGMSAPCCDETCLDRLALRECDTGTDTPRVEATQQGTLTGASVSYMGL
jgi:Cu2+-exporting ATPase